MRELYLDEFVCLLRQHFPCVEMTGQKIRAGSLISGNPPEFSHEIFEEAVCGEESNSTEPMYYLAVCSRDKLRKQVPSRSAYLDSTDGLILETKHEIGKLNKEILTLGDWAKSLECIIGERDQALRDLQKKMQNEVNQRDQGIRDLQKEMQEEVAGRDQRIIELQGRLAKEVDLRDQAIRNLQEEMKTRIADRDQRIMDLLNLLHEKEREFDDRGKWALSLQAEVERLTRIHQAFLYRILSRLGILPK
jgi:chromosome segregation ATPase